MAVVPPMDQFQKDSKKDDAIKVPLLIVRIDGIIYNTSKRERGGGREGGRREKEGGERRRERKRGDINLFYYFLDMKFQYISSDVPLPPIHEARHIPPPPLMDGIQTTPYTITPGPNCTTSSLTLIHRPHPLSADSASPHLGGFIHQSHYRDVTGTDMQLHPVNHYAPPPPLHSIPHSSSLSHHPLHTIGAYNGQNIFNPSVVSKLTPPILSHAPILTAE